MLQSLSIRVKNDYYKNNEDNLNNNNELYSKNKFSNIQLKKPQKRNNSNIKRQQNSKNSTNLNNINININKSNYINKNNSNNQINKFVDKKYREIESKYKKEINKEMKDDTLFDEDVINDIKEEIIVGNNIDTIEVVSNMASQTLKPKKNNKMNINDQSLNASQEKDFQIIESYCQLSAQKDETNNNDNSNKDNIIKDDESKMENNQVQELHNHVKKILDELN